MSNYVTVDNRNQNPNTDLAYIMPMVANEVAQRRKRADAVAASMNVLEQQALADPEKFKNATFDVTDNGLIGMNQAAKDLYAIKPEFSMQQEGFSNSEETLNDEGNAQLLQPYLDDKEAKENSDTAKAANAIARGDTDWYKLHLAQQQKQANDNGTVLPDLLDQIKERTTTDTNTQKDNNTSTTANTEANKTTPDQYVGPFNPDILAQINQGKEVAGATPVIPLANPSQTATNDGKALSGKEVVAAVDALAKSNPGKGANVSSKETKSDQKSAGASASEHSNYMGEFKGSSSTMEMKQGTITKSSQRENIIDTDKSSIAQLRRNAGLEAATNAFSLVNNNVETSKQMQNRLADRQAFIDKHMAGHGVTVNKTSVTPGEIKYTNTGAEGKQSAQMGQATSYNNSVTVKQGDVTGANVRMPSTPSDPSANEIQSEDYIDSDGNVAQSSTFKIDGDNIINSESSTGKMPVEWNNVPPAEKQSMQDAFNKAKKEGKADKYGYLYINFPSSIGNGVKVKWHKDSPAPAEGLIDPNGSYRKAFRQSIFRSGKAEITKKSNSDIKVDEKKQVHNTKPGGN